MALWEEVKDKAPTTNGGTVRSLGEREGGRWKDSFQQRPSRNGRCFSPLTRISLTLSRSFLFFLLVWSGARGEERRGADPSLPFSHSKLPTAKVNRALCSHPRRLPFFLNSTPVSYVRLFVNYRRRPANQPTSIHPSPQFGAETAM